MNWLRRMLDRRVAQPGIRPAPRPSPELAAAKKRHSELLSRADQAVKDAMDHADEVFMPPSYRGPDRRRMPR